MKKHFDLIAIGAGSGGLAVAEKAAQAGKRVAIIESQSIGGTCVNVGCVPKKVMWYAANTAEAIKHAADFGMGITASSFDWQALVQRREHYVSNITNYWQEYVADSGISVITGEASFIDQQTIEVNAERYTAEHIVIATGGKPMLPPVPGAELGMTSDDFFALQHQPKNIALIGAGYIGVELSGVMQSLGSKVTLFAMEDKVLPVFDQMISEVLEQSMRNQGIELRLGYQVSGLEQTANGIAVCSLAGTSLGGFDAVIWAVGRSANSAQLNLAAAGVELHDNGTIPVDDYQKTNVDGIYALGDVTGKIPLTPVAVAAGRKLADRLFNNLPASRLDYNQVPSVVFSHPPVASMGLTEAEASRQHLLVSIYESQFTPMRYALSDTPQTTAMKLICAGENEQVVGIHLIGDGVDEMLQGFSVAIKMGASKADFDNVVAIHPTSSEELVTMKRPVRRYLKTIEMEAA
ncbi:MAG: glutathione-disulfide reductase [Gammaproteobacteria bacterium]|nr:glutathione-disulfide reductase [Gammaproteobacteria bacterium]